MFRWPLGPRVEPDWRDRPAVTVSGTIARYSPDEQDEKGARHQLLIIKAAEVTAGPGVACPAPGEMIFVAIRYGDQEGLPAPIAGLAVGEPIEVRGVFVPADEARTQEDGSRLAVIHFTHRPLGWVKFDGRIYC